MTYLSNLLAQPYQAQLKFLQGSWRKIGQSTGYFKREWVKMLDSPPLLHITGRVRAYDLAATPEAEEGKPKARGDYTASVKMSRDRFGNYCIEHVSRFQKHSGEVIREIIRQAMEDGVDECNVVIPRDSGAGGISWHQYLSRTLAEHGVPTKAAKVSGHTSKLSRTLPLCTIAESGQLYCVKGDWNEDFFLEMENFIPNNRNQRDDQWDASGDAFNALARQLQLPTFALPDMSKAPTLAGISNNIQ